MSTRLTKPVTRLVEIDGQQWNVTITKDGVTYRQYKSRTPLVLPHGTGLVRAAMLKADAERAAKGKTKRRRVKRGAL